MTDAHSPGLVGSPVNRVDGPLKVSGAAPYPTDITRPGTAHAALVRSTIGAGRITRIDTKAAEAVPGVVGIITHHNAPRLERGPDFMLSGAPVPPLQSDQVRYHGQIVAFVVAETRRQATEAASLVTVEYERAAPVLGLDNTAAALTPNTWSLGTAYGDLDAQFDAAEVTYEQEFTTAENTNNPLGLMASLAEWDGDRLTLNESTQHPMYVRASLSAVLGVPEENIRVLVPYLGGGFGAGLIVWPHTLLTVAAARMFARPVKTELTRPEMFTAVGHRAATRQRVRIAATRDGKLLAIEHESLAAGSIDEREGVIGAPSYASGAAYATKAVRVNDRQAKLHHSTPGSMRAPGSAEGSFAVETAVNELAHDLGIDPVELRVRNFAAVNPETGLPWSSNALLDCYRVGAERFGWDRRDPRPGSMRDGRWLVGYGMAGVTFDWYQLTMQARVVLRADGTVVLRSAATDIGTGTYTVMTQLLAERLGLPLTRVLFELGDSDMPYASQSGGSALASSLAIAVDDAAGRLIAAFADLAGQDADSPLHGCGREDVTVKDGALVHRDDPTRGLSYADILARHNLSELTADGTCADGFGMDTRGMSPAGGFAAKFVEVRIDQDLGLLRVARVVSAIDAGRVLNPKLARSQIIGGTVMGISQALFEDTVRDRDSGRVANPTFADYLVPVNADVPDMDVVFVGEPDRLNPVGTKGVGEIGLNGIAAAITDAVRHATGKRVHSLPITIEQLL